MILIDMEMPPCCDECDLQFCVSLCCLGGGKQVEYPKAYNTRMEWCPLHEPSFKQDEIKEMQDKINEIKNILRRMS